MPFASISELPERVKKFSKKTQRQFLAVFNTVFDKVLKETKDRKQAERRAFMAANSVLKKRFKGVSKTIKKAIGSGFNNFG